MTPMNEENTSRASRRYKIRVYGPGVSEEHVGRYYIIFNDKEGCFHYVDELGLHHRIYNALVYVDEI